MRCGRSPASESEPSRRGLPQHQDRLRGSLPGWSALVLQYGVQGMAADLAEYRIIFGVSQEHNREVQGLALARARSASPSAW